ncbi:hypothetical protein Vdis_1028 [Vulcanisaeta distributa DSM 14429]|uniref:Uncharacterized protein n=1 Tax=Vulcanisaeta distributa (strain DSM 14429 / JCM 11212 / NBRC 100878 / IC-017) TaxID=572478 RepID=E1QQ45_VULDI|nr:hypothetical protein Vdis_1028 [Vulcanisaeta distributa DSM 14429]
MGIRTLSRLLLLSISRNGRSNATITNMRSLKQNTEEVIINVELELELTEGK